MAEKRYQPVQEGRSMWSTAAPPPLPTRENQEFRKVLASETKLTNERRSMENHIKKNGKKNLKSNAFPSLLRETVDAPLVYRQRRMKHIEEMSVEELFALARYFRPTKRCQETIVRSGAYSLENQNVMTRGIDREKEKSRLANIMAYGPEADQCEDLIKSNIVSRRQANLTPAPEKTADDEFDELINEIEEREEFLEKMDGLGVGAQGHRERIAQQIIEVLNKLRSINSPRYQSLMGKFEADWRKGDGSIINNIY